MRRTRLRHACANLRVVARPHPVAFVPHCHNASRTLCSAFLSEWPTHPKVQAQCLYLISARRELFKILRKMSNYTFLPKKYIDLEKSDTVPAIFSSEKEKFPFRKIHSEKVFFSSRRSFSWVVAGRHYARYCSWTG